MIHKTRFTMPQVGRWLPGYGFAVWVIREKIGPDGTPYPCAELRDLTTAFLVTLVQTSNQKWLLFVEFPKALSKAYPKFADKINKKDSYQTNTLGVGNAYALLIQILTMVLGLTQMAKVT